MVEVQHKFTITALVEEPGCVLFTLRNHLWVPQNANPLRPLLSGSTAGMRLPFPLLILSIFLPTADTLFIRKIKEDTLNINSRIHVTLWSNMLLVIHAMTGKIYILMVTLLLFTSFKWKSTPSRFFALYWSFRTTKCIPEGEKWFLV